MVWNFFKKILDKKEKKRPEAETLACRGPLASSATEPRAAFRQNTRISAEASPAPVIQDSGRGGVKQIVEPPAIETPACSALSEPPAAEKPAGDTAAAVSPVKPHAEKTDEELAQELNAISPEILSQAKTPQTRKLIIDIYRKMLIEGVDIKNEKEVKKWLKKHPEAVNGGEAHKIETFKREEPKVGRNDACPCGSGSKYKKCCGKGN